MRRPYHLSVPPLSNLSAKDSLGESQEMLPKHLALGRAHSSCYPGEFQELKEGGITGGRGEVCRVPTWWQVKRPGIYS